ncbi:MAG: protein kinase [Acidobacteria bacterium]|nr:protein kinase [Acidobacteriota bacterium]
MTASPDAEDPRLLSVASTIAKGLPVDWTTAPTDADPESTTILEELRRLESVCQASSPIPETWGPVEITGELGRGSYGTVYSALDQDLGLEIALKVIRPGRDGDDHDIRRALNEARLLAQVNHSNVVRVYSAERIGQEVGIAMELVRGRTLHWLVRAHGPFSASETMLIGQDLCRAVAAVHGARLLHGDIKANNVMRAHGGRTVLMDFGAGHDLKASPARTGRRTAGTPIYLAPEVMAGAPRTKASDIYSLGILLFYLATGSYPVDGQSRDDIERQHEAHAPRRLLRDVRPELPEAFIHVVDRATAERPEDRYQTAGEFEAALHRASQDEVVPEPVPPPIPRWALPLVAALAVAIGAGYQWWPSSTSAVPETSAVPASVAAVAAAPPATTTTADSYEVEAAFYRYQGGTAVRLQPGSRIAPGDELSFQIQSSVPTYVYVVNEDDRGEAYLLFPLPGQQLANPLPPGSRHEIPGVVNGERTNWQVSSAGGREHFVVFASPEPPSPAFERMFDSLPRPVPGAAPAPQPLSGELATVLRGVGGLKKAPARPAGERMSNEFTAPLPDARETARGVWVRQLTLENPGK